jgi:hypothetical protein
MKVWSDLSAVIKIALFCSVVGFLLGLCASGTIHPRGTTTTAASAWINAAPARASTGADSSHA